MVGDVNAVHSLVRYNERLVKIALTVGEDIVDLGEGLTSAEIVEGAAKMPGQHPNAVKEAETSAEKAPAAEEITPPAEAPAEEPTTEKKAKTKIKKS